MKKDEFRHSSIIFFLSVLYFDGKRTVLCGEKIRSPGSTHLYCDVESSVPNKKL